LVADKKQSAGFPTAIFPSFVTGALDAEGAGKPPQREPIIQFNRVKFTIERIAWIPRDAATSDRSGLAFAE